MKKIVLFGLILTMWGCGTPKKTVLQSPGPVLLKADTIKLEASRENLVNIKTVLDTVVRVTEFPKVLTTEDRVREMMREGINKNADWTEAVHYDVRKPNFVIIHHTAQGSINQTIRTFQLDHTKVSAHYVIGRNGQVVQMLNDYLRSWHAGRSKWGAITDMNSVSLGIELDNSGKEPFSEAQMRSLLTLLDTLKTKYNIPFTNFLGHADIAPTRKDDPSVFFPWKRLAEQGFGVWYDEYNLETPPESFNYVDALRIIGYDVSNLRSTIIAFKRKFIVTDLSETLTDYDKKVLYNLYRRYF